ncbi:hypothetical protein Goe24_01100 [Bacillus phage vB_BsuM-Goe24]|uniref:Uncharacterized protein n=1 Tax=Bacillus phage vB_BsuM-Goe3 TaxID=1933063 RepID=A0A217ER59_BPGO3|nr:hypothetical protein HWB07_gp198 [Bacillus phage vB_BsuM-Goe3]APZ82572.1 hypothetical protein Goe3_c11100 [Bacillus phage vB_BsuM-Goe3]QDP43135.1 hypothetical protein Goe7_c01100 [Bacillus phage vB_BveM-Goe7]WCS69485.1 hypothetical protein Goe24_01100 [Bacillus phage vB_BsuM-Goe24]
MKEAEEKIKIFQYLYKLHSCTTTEEKEEFIAKEGGALVSLQDASHAIMTQALEVVEYTEWAIAQAQLLQEKRLLAIIKALPKNVREDVIKALEEDDDDLLDENLNEDEKGDNNNVTN